MRPLVTLRTVGWLARQDRQSVSVALEHSPALGTFRHVTHIPRGMIRRLRKFSRKI